MVVLLLGGVGGPEFWVVGWCWISSTGRGVLGGGVGWWRWVVVLGGGVGWWCWVVALGEGKIRYKMQDIR